MARVKNHALRARIVQEKAKNIRRHPQPSMKAQPKGADGRYGGEKPKRKRGNGWTK
jgi:hypothetical protein